MDKLLELLVRLTGWALTRPPAARKEAAPKEVELPPAVRKFVCDEVDRACAEKPWGRNELSMPPKLLTALRAEIMRQLEEEPGPDPFAEASIPPELAEQFRQLIYQQLN